MSNITYFITAFGTFGSPNGFRQSYWFTDDRNIVRSIKTFDLNTNAIKLFPKTKAYAIRKDFAGEYNIISYSIYTYAKEQNSDRSGTFIGSSILFNNTIAEEQIIVNKLNEFHESLVDKNVQNDIITVNHSEKFIVIKPRDFDKIEFHLKPLKELDFIRSSGKNLVVFCDTNADKLEQLLKKAVDLLNVYDTIYFTDSRELAEFVNQKGIFKLIQNVGDKKDLDQELQNLYEERKRIKESSISEFEKEVQKLQDDKNKTLAEIREQIEQNVKLHQENDRKIKESRGDLQKVEQIYSDFSAKIKDLTNQIRLDKNLIEIKQIYNENKSRFIEGVNQLKKPSFINSISKVTAKSGLKSEQQYHGYGDNRRENGDRRAEENKIDMFKVATLLLFLLLIGTWVYFLFFNSKEETILIQPQRQEVSTQPKPKSPEVLPTPVQELNPKPNSELNANDCRNMAKILKYGTKAEDIVKTIFDKNPGEITGYYKGQEIIYTKQLIELNKTCFEQKEGVFFFAKDTLKRIPSFKK